LRTIILKVCKSTHDLDIKRHLASKNHRKFPGRTYTVQSGTSEGSALFIDDIDDDGDDNPTPDPTMSSFNAYTVRYVATKDETDLYGASQTNKEQANTYQFVNAVDMIWTTSDDDGLSEESSESDDDDDEWYGSDDPDDDWEG